VNFEWREDKNETNIIKHGFDFVDASRIFTMSILFWLDDREDYDEERWVALGMLDGRVVVVVYTEPYEDTIHFISLRKALPYERKRYERYLKNRLGTY
jgi:uncharacterized DUF497 family protein